MCWICQNLKMDPRKSTKMTMLIKLVNISLCSEKNIQILLKIYNWKKERKRNYKNVKVNLICDLLSKKITLMIWFQNILL